jgi:hypothetical protein
MNNNRDTIKLGFYSIKKYVETVKCRLKTSLLEWWWLISEKRCDGCAHSQEDEYNEAPKSFLQ